MSEVQDQGANRIGFWKTSLDFQAAPSPVSSQASPLCMSISGASSASVCLFQALWIRTPSKTSLDNNSLPPNVGLGLHHRIWSKHIRGLPSTFLHTPSPLATISLLSIIYLRFRFCFVYSCGLFYTLHISEFIWV